MRKVILINVALVLVAAIALAQTPPAPPTPAAPAAPETPATPRAPKAPRPPKPPRPEVYVRGSYLGIDSRDVTPERVPALKLKNDQGVEILMVDQDAPAGKAGLKEHDVILSYNGKSVQDVEQLRRMIRDTAPGNKINLGIVRDGQQQNVTVELAERRRITISGEPFRLHKLDIPPMPEIPDVPLVAMMGRRNGLTVENLSRQLGEFFGAKDGRGVLVRSVEKNSPAEMAGFKAGDVIIRVGNEPIENMNDWNQTLRQQQSGKVPVTVIREKREQTFTLSLPERRGDRSSSSFGGFDDFDKISIELGDLGPQIRKEMETSRLELEKIFKDQKFQQQMRDAQREFKKSFEINKKELHKQMENTQKEMEKAHKDMERTMQELKDQKITIQMDDDHNEFR